MSGNAGNAGSQYGTLCGPRAPEHTNNLPPVPQLHQQPLVELLNECKACTHVAPVTDEQKVSAVGWPLYTFPVHGLLRFKSLG